MSRPLPLQESRVQKVSNWEIPNAAVAIRITGMVTAVPVTVVLAS